MEANYRALALAKAKFGKKLSKASQRMMRVGRRVTKTVKKRTGMRKRGPSRKTP